MAQIQGGTTYSTGDQILATNLNSHVNNAILLPGAISEQTAAAIANLGDSVLGLQSGALKKITVTQIGAATSQDLSGLVKADGTVAMSANLSLFSSTGLGALSAAPASYVDDKVASTYIKASSAEVAAFSAVAKYVSPERLPDAFASSQTANGWVKLPGGIIIQWGTATSSAGPGQANVTWPTPFTTAVYSVSIAAISGFPVGGIWGYTSASTTGMTAYCNNLSGGGINAQATWVAIGK